MNDEWKNRLGNDPWKNAIRRECDEIQKLLLDEEKRAAVGSAAQGSPPGGPDRIQFKQSLEYESFEMDQGVVAPFGQSHAVFQTGRFFLIGPTRRAVEKLEKIWLPAQNDTGDREKHPIKHVHVILLCWDEAHWSGLTHLADILKESEIPMTIWSSYWIWEEVSGKLAEHDESKQIAASLLKAKFLGDDDRVAGAEADLNEIKVAAFEKSRTWDLTCGVSVSLSYSLSSLPLLRAEFGCNNFRIVIDPGLLSLLRPGGTPLAGLLEQDGQTVTVDGGLPDRRTEVQESVNRTHSLLKQIPDLNNPTHESEERLEHWRPGLLHASFLGFNRPVDLLRRKDIQPFAKHPAWRQKSRRMPATQKRTLSSKKAPAILTETVLVLLCGGLMDKVQRNLIDPGYQLDICTGRGKSKAIHKMSILKWRLLQIREWYQDSVKSEKPPLPVVLLTTPESEDDVRRLAADMRSEVKSLELLPVCAQLIPNYQENAIETEEDGGWKLHPRGHMDTIRFLVARKEMFQGKKICLVVAFNNLGDVFNAETLNRIHHFRESRHKYGVELFQYQRKENDADRRWDQLSFCLNPNRPRLIKNSYLSNTEQVPESPPRFYSSLTCYVRLDSLKEEDVREIGFIIDENGQGVTRPRQDIDLITHHASSSTMAFLKLGNAPSLYAFDRYLGVRTQDHVRHVAFTKEFDRVGVVKNNSAPPVSDADLKNVPIWEMIPCRQSYPWGGYEIATLKGDKGDPPEMIAETWEVSGYSHAQSSVALDDKRTLLLASALENTGLPRCNIILKYLDCHGPLSLQVHPSEDAARYLDGKRFPLRDEQGKEESFFVIDTAHGREFNLFLGFQKERLSELADAIRPKILRYVHQPESDSVKIVDDIVAAMRTVLRKSFLPKVVKFLKFLRDPSRKGPLLEKSQIEHFDKELLEKLGDLFSERVGAAIDFHIVTGSNKSQSPSRSESLGKEFLLGGVAVIGLIEALRDYFNDRLRETKQSKEILDAARKLFGEDFQKGGDGKELDAHPLLNLFCRLKAEKDSWVRIPPGIVHGWQGGGNRLVEIGYASDNTLRVLDFGREPDQAREMHYRQAMCALSPFSFFDQDSVQKLLGVGPPNIHGLSPCHDLLDHRLYHGERKIELPSIRGLPAYVMNPDGALTLTLTHPKHPPVRRIIERMRTVLVHSRDDGTLKLDPQQEDNRVLYLVARKPAPPLLALCPGGTDWEFALWQDQQLPAAQRVATPKKSATLKQLLKDRSLADLRKKCEKPRIALSWPGFVLRSADAGTERCYSTALGNPTANEVEQWISAFAPDQTDKHQVLSDFHAALLGEVRHPLGRLSIEKPGMLINVGSGLCLSFYHPEFHQDSRLDDLFHDNWLTVCSAIGRWLFVDSRSGQMTKGEGKREAPLKQLVFCEKPSDTEGDGQRIRASKWFSAAGIVARSKNGNSAVTMDQINRAQGQSLAAELLKLMDATSNPSITETVIDLGEKLAEVVDFARKMLRGEFGFPRGLTTRLNGNQLAKLSEECPRNIVLTGLVGQHFGRHLRRGPEPFEDLLTWSLKNSLRGSQHVWRSDIGSVAERELEGFLFYLNYKDRQASKKSKP